MARANNLHSRLITWAKIVLPLTALGLLSTLFLISRTIDPTQSLDNKPIDLRQRASDQGARNPSFAGVTKRGDEVAFRADYVRPDADDLRRFLTESVYAELRLTTGTTIDIRADRADLHQGDLTATLTGGVRVTVSTGYVIDTETLITRLDRIYAEAPGRVTSTGPLGDLDAGRMVLDTGPGTDDAHLLFSEGVKLLYTPATTKD